MRTLKKTLCLVLALVMVLGLCVTSVSAYDAEEVFTDYDQVKHEEAVQVLSMIGVVNGNGDGTLTPGKTLSRAEMAALIMQLMGGADGSYVAVPTFSDTVDAPAWIRKAIGFCQAQGIMIGYDDGTVRPYQDVTGYEVASMMLRIIGYDMVKASEEIGDWTFATYRYVKQIDLDADLLGTYETYDEDYELGAPMPREDAFQMVFNTLQATMVEYLPTTISGLPTPVTDKKQIKYDKTGTATDNSLEVVERYYPTLELDNGTAVPATGRDEFKRPGHTWTYSKTNDSVFIIDTPIATYDGNFTGKDAKALGTNSKVYNDGTYTVYYNGDNGNTLEFEEDSKSTSNNGLWLNDNTGVPGYEVEVYKTGATTYDIIVCEAYAAKVKSLKAGIGKKDITVEVYEHTQDTTAVTLTVKAANPMTGADADDAWAALSGYAEDDYIAVYVKGGFHTAPVPSSGTYILAVADLEPVDVRIQRINDTGKKVTSSVLTTDGTTYKINNEAMVIDNTGAVSNKVATGSAASRKMTTGTATLYLLGGNILLVDHSAAPVTSGYAYLYDSKAANANGENKWESEGGANAGAITNTYMIRLLMTDGTTVETEYKSATNPNTQLGALVYYSINGKGEYSLTHIAGTAASSKNLAITKNKSQGTLDSNPIAFDSKTVFMVVTTDNVTTFPDGSTDDGTPKDANKPMNFMKSVSFYSIYNVPDYNLSAATTFITSMQDIKANGDCGDPADDNQEIARVVLIIDPDTSSREGLHFILKNGNATLVREVISETKTIEYYEYDAVVDGVKTTVKVDATKLADVFGAGDYVLCKNPTVDTDGLITNVVSKINPASNSDDITAISSSVGAVKNDHIKIGGQDYLVSVSETVAFEVDATKKEIKELTLDEIDDGTYSNGLTVSDDAKGILSVLLLFTGALTANT